jgi:hypothetical protein
MSTIFNIRYTFQIDNSNPIIINIPIDEKSLSLSSYEFKVQDWLYLDFHKCPNCPLSSSDTKFCPVAKAIQPLIETFQNAKSFSQCHVIVEVPERTYSKHTSFQEAIRSILGIFMPVSGCPNLAWLRPMVRFHLPFASTNETLFRSIGSYLIAQFLRNTSGDTPDWNLQHLKYLYQQVHIVNTHFANRLRAAISEDAAANSLVILDVFSQSVPFAIDRNLHSLNEIFQPLLQAVARSKQKK